MKAIKISKFQIVWTLGVHRARHSWFVHRNYDDGPAVVWRRTGKGEFWVNNCWMMAPSTFLIRLVNVPPMDRQGHLGQSSGYTRANGNGDDFSQGKHSEGF